MHPWPLMEVALDDVAPAEIILSWGRDDDRLTRSIQQVGLSSPPILQPREGGYLPVCGRRRLAAARKLNIDRLTAFVLPEETTAAEALALAVEENLGHREFNEAEKALAVDQLARALGDDVVLEKFARHIGLPPRPRYILRAKKLVRAGPEILDALASGALDPETALQMAEFPPEDRQAFTGLFDALQPGRNKREKILTWAVEVAARENSTPAAVLDEPPIREALEAAGLQRGQKESRVREYLRRRRFPTLAGLEEKRADLIKTAPLPEGARFTGDPSFEGLRYELAVPFENLEDFRRKAVKLVQLADDPDFRDLLDLG